MFHHSNIVREPVAASPLHGRVYRQDKPSTQASPAGWPFPALRWGLACYGVTGLLVLLGAIFGHDLVFRPPDAPRPDRFLKSLCNWDGNWFLDITRLGYVYVAHEQSSTAFLPGYPALARLIVKATGARPEVALLLISHLSFLAALVVLAAYVRLRFPNGPEHLPGFVLLTATLLPTSFFFRMGYSESLFLLCAVLSLYLMERKAAPWLVAAVIGFASGVRLPGICLLLPFALYLWNRSAIKREFFQKLLVLAPLACWGITIFTFFTWHKFGEPFAFAKAQAEWNLRVAPSLSDKLYSLATLEPVRSVFDPSSPGYWRKVSLYQNPFFSLAVANPLYFVFAVLLIGVGIYRRWLSTSEWLFSASLLFIAYAGRGYDMCMQSSGRFVAVIFPMYFVAGHLLARCPPPLAAAILTCSGVLLTIYSALFAAHHLLI